MWTLGIRSINAECATTGEAWMDVSQNDNDAFAPLIERFNETRMFGIERVWRQARINSIVMP